uniref:Zinc finger, CCHC-type n=1 Tax=Tanacetum cinerariifolium TaxID=118510 RepID=A0A6L2NHJ4_TANCI|nr:hypothetical protein [Tanacetum cinerariifolium]
MTTSSANNLVFRGFFEKKLTGLNFMDWYRQLRIVLSIDDKLNYLEQPIPPAPVVHAGHHVAPEILAAHNAWIKGSKEIAGLMLITMGPEIQRNLETLHAHEMLLKLKTLSYVLKMKGYIENLERLGNPVTLGLSVSLILIGLRKEFNGFVQNYNMHSLGKTINELHAMLKLHEQTLPKNNAPALHAIRAGKGLRASRKLKPGALSLYVGNGQREAVEAIGFFNLCLLSGLDIVLNNCHYAPFITRGVISVSRLYKDGFINRFVNNTIQVSRNSMVYFSAILRDDIFEIDLSNSYTNESSIYVVRNKRAKLDLDYALLWHCRLRHISKKRIEKLQHDELLNSTDLRDFKKCVSCMSEKMARKPYTHQVERAKDLLGLIHTDVCVPFKIMSRQGASYFVTFTDDFSRYGYVYLMKHKYEVFETLRVFQKEVENQLDASLNHEEDDLEIDEPQSDIVPIRRSTRTRHAPDRMCLYIDAEEHELGDLGEAANYKAALLDPESGKWFNAMNVEMQSMKNNEVWVLVELSPNGKTVDIRAIRILIAIAAYYDYEIWQMDVKTALLNRYLNEEVYIEQPEGEAAYILGIKIYRDRSRRLIGLCQSAYIKKILKRYCMENSKCGSIPMQEKLKLSKSQGVSTPAELKRIQNIPYASAVGFIMYAVRCTRPDVAFAQNTGYVFVLNGGAVDWKSSKQSIFATSSAEAEYIAAFDAFKEAVWVRKFISGLGFVLTIEEPISVYCDNIGAIAIANESGITKVARHFHAKVHYLLEVIE